MPTFRDAIVDYIRANAKPVDKFSHQPRLYELTRAIGSGLDYDDDVVFAAAWLHDIGVFIGHRPEEPEALAAWDMIAYAEKVVPQVLDDAGFPKGKIEAVLEVIRTHQPSSQPATVEATVVRDADILEQLGATAILRTVSKVGRDTRFHTFEDALKALQSNVDTLPALLKLEASRKLAGPRVDHLRAFLQQAWSEGIR